MQITQPGVSLLKNQEKSFSEGHWELFSYVQTQRVWKVILEHCDDNHGQLQKCKFFAKDVGAHFVPSAEHSLNKLVDEFVSEYCEIVGQGRSIIDKHSCLIRRKKLS